MRLHYLQHVPFEDLANIAGWAQQRNFSLSRTRLDLDEPLPDPDSFDWLVIMGGPMNILDDHLHPWLAPEREFISRSIHSGKVVLGVCLGAQFIAHGLGGTVFRNPHREIGWFPVTLTEEAIRLPLFQGLEPRFEAFHWHGDTFSLPPGALRAAGSEACANQAFVYDQGRVVALQFHLESTPASVEALIAHCSGELTVGPYVQQPEEMLARPERFDRIRRIMERMLDAVHNRYGS